MQDIAWDYGLAKAGIVYAHEVNKTPFRIFTQGMNHKNTTGLGHGLDDQDTGHDRSLREMTGEKRLVDRNVFDPGRPLAQFDVAYTVNKKKRESVRYLANNVAYFQYIQ
jgi:hypothetical protein